MSKTDPSNDARGQFAKSQADGKNDGQASATPRAVTGRDDATVANSDRNSSPSPGFDIRQQTNRRN